ARATAEAVLGLVGGGGRGVADDLPDATRAALLREALTGLDDNADADLAAPVLGELALALMLTDLDDERAALARRSLEVARRSGRPEVVARALLASRLAVLGAEQADARLDATSEVLALPARSRPPDVTLAALIGRHEDLLLCGDRTAARQALVDADAVLVRYDHPYWRWTVATWRALGAVIDGRLDDAEQAAFAASAHQSDHPEAAACLGVTLVDIRLYQGRAGEVIALLRDAADANAHIPCYRAVLALCCAESGDLDGARAAFDVFAGDGFRTIPDDTNRLLTLAVLADVAVTLGDAVAGAALTDLLAPHRGRQVILNCFGGGGAYWGPVSHQLARLAHQRGDEVAAGELAGEAATEAETFEAPLARARVESVRRVP
ncbi:MAG: hypothetical protein JWM05_1883, partial [Acidimicrobiales bacterium]|nr:hypothetical protein [Acidimicrobiales bacterium]